MLSMFICYLCRTIQCFTSSNYIRIVNSVVAMECWCLLLRAVLRRRDTQFLFRNPFKPKLMARRHFVCCGRTYIRSFHQDEIRCGMLKTIPKQTVEKKRVECIINNDRVQ